MAGEEDIDDFLDGLIDSLLLKEGDDSLSSVGINKVILGTFPGGEIPDDSLILLITQFGQLLTTAYQRIIPHHIVFFLMFQ